MVLSGGIQSYFTDAVVRARLRSTLLAAFARVMSSLISPRVRSPVPPARRRASGHAAPPDAAPPDAPSPGDGSASDDSARHGGVARLTARLRDKVSAGDWLPILRSLPAGKGGVGLTFDDGPAPETTPLLVRLLRAHGAMATFFLTGQRAATTPALVGALVEAGHDVFPHGWRHVRHDRLAPEELIADMARTEQVLARFRVAPSPYLVRLPYALGHTTARVHRALRAWRADAQIVHWNHDTHDWALADGCGDLAQLRAVCADAADRTVARPDLAGCILLMHEYPFDVTAPLCAAIAPVFVSALLERLRARGLHGRRVPPLRPQPLFRRFVRG